MSDRTRSTLVIARRRLLDSFINPGFYVTLSISLAIAFAAVVSFAAAVDSSGFNYRLSPLYDVVGGLIVGAFGDALLAKTFAQGPLLFALHGAFVPVLLYLAFASVYRFGAERSSGALELYTYGPTDATAYFLGSVMKDAVLTLVALASILLFLLALAAVDNLAITPALLTSAEVLFLAALGIYAYGVLVSVCVDNGSAALSIFIAAVATFFLFLIGSYAIAVGYAASLVSMVSRVVGWFSPLAYWALFLRSREAAEAGGLILALAGEIALTALLLAASHLIVRARGVRA